MSCRNSYAAVSKKGGGNERKELRIEKCEGEFHCLLAERRNRKRDKGNFARSVFRAM